MAVHGTGTPLGDPIEVGALAGALSAAGHEHVPPCKLTLGSIKVCHPPHGLCIASADMRRESVHLLLNARQRQALCHNRPVVTL